MKKIQMFLPVLVAGMLNAQPAYQWAKQTGSQYSDYGSAIATDAAGNVYAAGSFSGTADFDHGSGTFTMASQGQYDIFITKTDAAGNFQWAKQVGGIGPDYCTALTLDNSGNIYAIGTFSGTVDFDPGASVTNFVAAGSAPEKYILKLSSAGNYAWAQNFFGNLEATGVDADSNGDVVVVGRFLSTQTLQGFTVTSLGATDIFMMKFNGTGTVQWAKSIGSSSNEQGNAVALDNSGNVFVGGVFDAAMDFDPSGSTFNMTGSNTDAFILKLDPSGNFQWARQASGAGVSYLYSMIADANGNIFSTGFIGAGGATDFDPSASAFNLNSGGTSNPFVWKLDGSGNFGWAASFSGSSSAEGRAIGLDMNGHAVVSGIYYFTYDFDPGAATFTLNPQGSSDIFLCSLDNSNGSFKWAASMGGVTMDFCYAMALTNNNAVYTTGYFTNAADFDPGTPTTNLNATGMEDIFISRLCIVPLPPAVTGPSSTLQSCAGSTFVLTATGTGSITWYTSPTGGTSLATGSSFTTPAVNVTSSYYAEATTCGASVARTQVNILVEPLPTIGAVQDRTLVCANEPVTITASGAVTYSVGGTPLSGSTTVLYPKADSTILVLGTGTNNCTGGKYYNIKVQACTNIGENSENAGVAFPNPTTGKFEIATDNKNDGASVLVRDVSGRLVYHQHFRGEKIAVDLSDLPGGIYIFTIRQNDRNATSGKIVLQH